MIEYIGKKFDWMIWPFAIYWGVFLTSVFINLVFPGGGLALALYYIILIPVFSFIVLKLFELLILSMKDRGRILTRFIMILINFIILLVAIFWSSFSGYNQEPSISWFFTLIISLVIIPFVFSYIMWKLINRR